MSIISISSLSLINPISIYITRHYLGWCSDGFGWIIVKRFVVYIVIVGLFVAVVMFFLINLNIIQKQLSFSEIYLIIPLLIVVSTVSTYPQELLNIIGKPQAFIALTNLELWGKIGAISFSALLFLPTAITVIYSIMFWGMLFSLLSVFVLYRGIRGFKENSSFITIAGIKNIFIFAWPFSIATGLYWCQTDGYRFVMQNVAGVESVGKFVVAFSVGATLMIALDTLFHQLYLPVYYGEIAVETMEAHISAWNKYAQKVVSVFVPAGLFVACAGPYLSFWLLHKTYWDMGAYAAFGAISQLFRIFSGAFVNGIITRKLTSGLILPNLIGAIMALTGTYFLALNSPIIGAGTSLLISYATVSLGLYFKLRNRLAIKLPVALFNKVLIAVAPVCVFLIILHRAGFSTKLVPNIIIISISGFYLIFLQWKFSRDIWFVDNSMSSGKNNEK